MADPKKLQSSSGRNESEIQTSEHLSEELETSQSSNDFEASDDESITSDDSDMESFSAYLSKIEQLLRDIGLDGFTVESIQHGYDFENCVYALKSCSVEEEQYILRVPVFLSSKDFDDDRYLPVLNSVTVLNSLAEALIVPRVKAYSATKDNALGKPFMVQAMLPGQSLDKLWSELPHEDRLEIVDLFVELLAKHEAITYPKAGGLEASSSIASSMNDFAPLAAAFPNVKPFDEGDEEFLENPQVLRDRAGADVKASLISHLNGFIAMDIRKEGEENEFLAPKLRGLLAIIDELDREGAFAATPQIINLHHWDLEPRNIMVAQDNGTWRITGVIDWDETQANSRVLTRKPPSWIWDFDDEEITGYMNCDFRAIFPLTEKNMALKDRFDTKAAESLPDYLEEAYGTGQWLRRVWLFAKDEIHSSYILDLLDETLKDWADRPKQTATRPVQTPLVVPEIMILNEPGL
ncbi:MAG: hypothetical protein Q9195_005960 [Heterodermia aff. obscurata]